MNDVLSQVLQAVIIALVPIIASGIITLIKNSVKKIENETAKKYAEQIATAVSDAVSATSQIYVDSLKKQNKFDVDAQKEAAQLALDICIESLSQSCKEFVKKEYGGLGDYLSGKIEAEVRWQKSKLL